MPNEGLMHVLSHMMEKGNLAKWLVKEGDQVKSGDVIAEIETDKATMEVEAVDEGTVARIVVPAGTEGVKVNAVIAVLAADGEDAGVAAKGSRAAPAKAEAPKAAPSSGPAGHLLPDGEKREPAPAPTATNGSAAAPAASPQRGEGGSRSEPGEGVSRVFASPLARR